QAGRCHLDAASGLVDSYSPGVIRWKLARFNFPTAVCILDYYHACEHLTLLTQALYGEGSALAKKRYRQWRKALLKDKIAQIISQAKAVLPSRAEPRKLVKKQIAYFERNRSRML